MGATSGLWTQTSGDDFVLPAPPLVLPPLSLLSLAITHIDTEDMVTLAAVAADKAASTYEALNIGTGTPGESDSEADAAKALADLQSEYDEAITYANAQRDRVALLSRWEGGFQYLPELGNSALSVFSPGSGNTKPTGNNQTGFAAYDPFVVVGLDDRSAFGYPNTDFASRQQRVIRALLNHEAWQAEYEFWTGTQVATNYHLSCSPNTGLVSPHRTLLNAWPNPTATPGTVLGVAQGLAGSLASLDQAIADSDAGTGMIHASPFVIQEWMKLYPFIRDSNGRVYTVNHNLLVPGYGYPGTGPDQASRNITDGVTTAGSTTLTSASAAFTGLDVGRPVVETDSNGFIPAGTTIVSVTSATTVVMSNPATAGTAIDITISGTGGRATGSPQQWAYATEQVYSCIGDIETYPYSIRETAPALNVNNDVPVRAERTRGLITNRLLRAAVLVDTTTL